MSALKPIIRYRSQSAGHGDCHFVSLFTGLDERGAIAAGSQSRGARIAGPQCGACLPRGHEPQDEICCNPSCILASHASCTSTDHSALVSSIRSRTSPARLSQAPYFERMVWGAIGWREYGCWQWTRAREALAGPWWTVWWESACISTSVIRSVASLLLSVSLAGCPHHFVASEETNSSS